MTDLVITDLGAGAAGEHLVCADLLLQGYRAFMSDQNCPYDIAVDAGRLIRIQVKTTRAARSIPQRATHIASYMWNVRRAGKGGRRVYGDDEFDMLALVALDTRKIAYVAGPQRKQTIHIRPNDDSPQGKTFSQFPFSSALSALGVSL